LSATAELLFLYMCYSYDIIILLVVHSVSYFPVML